MIFGEGLDVVQRVDAAGGGLESARVDVGGVDQRAIQKSLFAKQDRKRMQFFAAAAPRDPHLERRIGSKVRHDLLADRAEVAGITEHLADLHGQVVEQAGEHGGIVQHSVLQG